MRTLTDFRPDLGSFFDISPELLCVSTMDGLFLRVNRTWAVTFGYPPEAMAGHDFRDFVHPDDIAKGQNALRQLAETGELLGFVDRYRCQDGSYRHLEWFARTDGTMIFASARDITERITTEQALANSRELLHLTLLSVGDGVIVTDPQGRISLINRTAEQLTGWTEAEATGHPLDEVFAISAPMLTGQTNAADLSEPFEAVTNAHAEIAVRNAPSIDIEYSLSPIFSGSGQFSGSILVFRDITQRSEQLSQIRYLSYHDALTGLYNRRFLEEEMRRLGTGRSLPVSVIMGDVNQLKLVNDAFGHDKGDELLTKAAQAIQRGCRAEDLVSRWGGDEFLIYLPGTDAAAAEQIIHRIEELCTHEHVNSIPLSIAFGTATQTTMSESIAETLRLAEDRMYRNKTINSGRSREDLVEDIASSLYARAPGERRHARRVSLLCRQMAQALGMDSARTQLLTTAGLMHDIGKVAVASDILDKAGTLTGEEWVRIRQHAEVGFRIVSTAHALAGIGSAILAHHERWDGTGYPSGIKWQAIPFEARILALADSYATMTSPQPYRGRMSHEQAVAEIRRNAGTQFDPELVETFLAKVAPDMPQARRSRAGRADAGPASPAAGTARR